MHLAKTATSIGMSVALVAGLTFAVVSPAQAATLTKITYQPKSVTWEYGSTATFSVKAKGTKLKYRWYVKKPGSSRFVAVSSKVTGAHTRILKVVATKSGNKSKYRVIVTGSRGKSTSKTATLTTVAATTKITKNPVAATVVSGAKVTLRVTATARSKLKYQWYSRPAGAKKWTTLKSTNAKAAAYTFTSNYAAHNKRVFKVIVTSKTSSISSRSVALKVIPKSTIVKATLSNATINRYGSNTTKTYSVSATGESLTYTWQSRPTASAAWVNIAGARSASYTVSSSIWKSGTSFRVIVAGAGGTVTSSSATVKVLVPTNTPAADAQSAFGYSGLTQGVDLSAYQYTPTAKVNMSKIAAWTGTNGFSILRNGTGAIPRNEQYTNRCAGTTLKTGNVPVVQDCAYSTLADQAETTKLRLGHYWFNGWIAPLDTTSGNIFSGPFSAADSADQFVSWLIADGNYTKTDTDPLVLDIEAGSTYIKTSGGKKYTLKQRAWNASEAKDFLAQVKTNLTSKGYKANLYVYMSASVATQKKNGAYVWKDVAAIARLWVASWGSNNGRIPSTEPSVGPWTGKNGGWSIWQYTSNATISGSNVGRVDADIAKSDAWMPR